MKKVVNFGQTPEYYGTGNASNDFIATPWVPDADGYVTEMGIEVIDLTNSNARVMLGIYDNRRSQLLGGGKPKQLLGSTEMITQDKIGMLMGEMTFPTHVKEGRKYWVCFLENGIHPEVVLGYGRGPYFLIFSIGRECWGVDPPFVALPDVLSEYYRRAFSLREDFNYNVRVVLDTQEELQ